MARTHRNADFEKIWERVKDTMLDRLYQRGMFIQTTCERAEVHNYQQMKTLLEDLTLKYPKDAKLISIGQSLGYEHDSNALDIWSLQLPAIKKPEQTAFFVSGHHYHELSGPETVYEIAKRILESYSQGNTNLQKMRQSTTLILLPQIDVDAYNRLETALGSDEEKFYLQGYSRLIDPNLPLIQREVDSIFIASPEYNFYSFNAKDPHFKYGKTVMNAIDDIITHFGKPYLAFDYHEQDTETEDPPDLGKFYVMPFRPRAPPLYVYAEVVKSYPVIAKKRSYIEEERMPMQTFSGYLARLGASSFGFETPSTDYTLHQRIEMNLIATDRILARHYLGV